MSVILHKFRNYQPSPDTETLFLGIFIPDHSKIDFFYGRSRNFLWHLLPKCWGMDSLMDLPLTVKQQFMTNLKIDFVDLIEALNVPDGEEDNSDDSFIDSHVEQWKDIIGLIDTLPNLKNVYFTRKTFNNIPQIRTQLTGIAKHCKAKSIRICKLETPARFFSEEKQQQWIDTIILQRSCLRV